jgi:hypothetical protein
VPTGPQFDVIFSFLKTVHLTAFEKSGKFAPAPATDLPLP